jgi:hypothetical protein
MLEKSWASDPTICAETLRKYADLHFPAVRPEGIPATIRNLFNTFTQQFTEA